MKRLELRNEQVWRACRLCPYECGVNRLAGQKGRCGETAEMRVAALEAHFGEEPPIAGTHGSGTVFFSGCALQCAFCQNYQLSHEHVGQPMTVSETADRIAALAATRPIHNLNFVTPDHFFPHTVAISDAVRVRGLALPIVYNLSGYQRVAVLRALEADADIYLPDFKYADRDLAETLSHCRAYPSVALDALAEMVRQKGFLDACEQDDAAAIAHKGVLVRHLILPGQVQNSLDVLSMLFLEFGPDLPLSLMSQYYPVRPCPVPELDRRITAAEFQQVYAHAHSLGFRSLFVQFPESSAVQNPEFLPDFTRPRPFAGNRRERKETRGSS
jgi:putative pyruvate formate lyase activating enzyme